MTAALPLGLVSKPTAKRSPRLGSTTPLSASRTAGSSTASQPRIMVQRVESVRTTSATLDQLRTEFARSEHRDTYKAASSAVDRLLQGTDGCPEEHVFLEALDLVKTLTTPWGVRFGGWLLQTMAARRPGLCAANIAALGAVSLPSLLRSAHRDDDRAYILDTVAVVLGAVQPCFLGAAPDEAHHGYRRYFYPLLAPLVQPLMSHGADQAWAADGIAAVLRSSDEMLTGTPRSVTGPANGELEETLQHVFDVAVDTLCAGPAGRVHDDALCPFLRLVAQVADAALSLGSVHADLYSADELLGVSQRRFVSACLHLTTHAAWKVRLEALHVLCVLTRGGFGSRWFVQRGVAKWVDSFRDTAQSLAKTDKIATVRNAAKEVLGGLAPAGQYHHEPPPPSPAAAAPQPQAAPHSPASRQGSSPPAAAAAAGAAGMSCRACGQPPLAAHDRFCAYCGESRSPHQGTPLPPGGDAPPTPEPLPSPTEPSVLDRVAIMLLQPCELDLAVFRGLLVQLSEPDLHRVCLNVARRVGWVAGTHAKHGLIDTLFTALDVLFASFNPHFSEQNGACLTKVLHYASTVPQFRDVAGDSLARLAQVVR